MADTTEGDTMVLYLDILILALITFIIGLVIHLFIIAINVNDWRKGRSVTPVDQVITYLGISRMCAQCFITIYPFVFALLLKNLDLHVAQLIVDAIYSFSNYVNTWLTSLLSIVFCLKISSLRTRLFLYLRRMIEQRTENFIVASVLLSAVNCLLPLLPAIIEVTKSETNNTTIDNSIMACNFLDSIYAHAVGGFIPLLFYVTSSVFLVTSLYHHTWKMKMSGNTSINLETFYSAIKFVSFTFIYNTVYVTGHIVHSVYYYLYCVELVWLTIALGFLPALHSFYLIYRTAKLRSQMSKVLQNVMDFFLQRKDPETTEDIEVVQVAQCGK